MKRLQVPPFMCSNPDSKQEERFVWGELRIFKSVDNTPKWGDLKHVSISCENRYPTWEEILKVKDKIFGDVDCMMVMPKKEDYINVSKNCFHVWRTPEKWGLK